jgi:leucyl/phenylalanyl-tRNA--protein transferase
VAGADPAAQHSSGEEQVALQGHAGDPDRRGGATPPAGPASLAASRWLFPEPEQAGAGGVVGIGADLEPETLVHAYRQGIFPWPHPGTPLPWFSPDPRGVLLPDGLRVSRSLRQRLRHCGWQTTVDAAFDQVIAACAERGDGEGTWITARMRAAYRRLHRLGWAHSLEVWDGAALVGGLYGLGIGGVFTGESMFHRASDASKVALVDLVARFAEAGGSLIDVQLVTPHLASLGARELPRRVYLSLLRQARDDPVRLAEDRRPVATLAADG